jgi:hypothetical protein
MRTSSRLAAWRLLLLAASPLLVVGALRHPRVPGMPAMLAHPDWLLSHLAALAGYLSLLGGLVLLRRAGGGPPGPWLRLAIVGAALQAVEAVFHAAAVVDLGRLNAGHATPVLSTHLALAALLYPLFSLSMIGLIVAGARGRALGSWWIAPLGLLGVLSHGAAAIVVVVLGMTGLGALFAGIALFGLWLLPAALWPARHPAGAAETRPAHLPGRSSPAVG